MGLMSLFKETLLYLPVSLLPSAHTEERPWKDQPRRGPSVRWEDRFHEKMNLLVP